MVRLFTLMGNHPHALPIKKGEIRSPLLQLDFAEQAQINAAFKPFVRELRYDCGELAIGTFLQALAYKKPLVLLPVVINSRFHQGSIHYDAGRGHLAPKDLEGRSVATRIYTQTTGIWVRGILRQEFGVDDAKVTWMTFDDGHLAEYRDPSNCRRVGPGKDPDEMLRSGEVAAAIPFTLATNAHLPPGIKPLISDPDRSARAWYDRHRAIPMNHVLVVQRALIDREPEAVRGLYRLFVRAKQTLPPPPDGVDMIPTGVTAMAKGLDLVAQFAFEQRIVPRRYTADELFAPARDLLGAEAA